MIEKQKWQEIGDLTKSIRNGLLRLRKLSSEVNMRKKEMDPLIKTARNLDEYRSRAENFMFSKGETDIHIFYGGEKE